MKETETDLRTLSGKTAIPFSALVRLAVQHGLPSLKQSLRISEEAAARRSYAGGSLCISNPGGFLYAACPFSGGCYWGRS